MALVKFWMLFVEGGAENGIQIKRYHDEREAIAEAERLARGKGIVYLLKTIKVCRQGFQWEKLTNSFWGNPFKGGDYGLAAGLWEGQTKEGPGQTVKASQGSECPRCGGSHSPKVRCPTPGYP